MFDLAIPSRPTIALFVEDLVTRDYLQAVWESPVDVAFRLGGGNEGVASLVKMFEEQQCPNAFGVVDRDFRPSNVAEWTNPNRTFRTFVLPVHEVENYLLDADALHASRYRRHDFDAGAIDARMADRASRLAWWAACRETISELKRRFREPFVGDPRQVIDDEASARRHICESAWFAKLAGEAARSTEDAVHILLVENHARAQRQIADGSWRREFSGKEILRDVGGWLSDERQTETLLADLAKGVAKWQVEKKKVPPDLIRLLDALRERIRR